MKIEFDSVLEELNYMLENQIHMGDIYRVHVDFLIRIRDELAKYEGRWRNEKKLPDKFEV